jgi:hypothetical protein
MKREQNLWQANSFVRGIIDKLCSVATAVYCAMVKVAPAPFPTSMVLRNSYFDISPSFRDLDDAVMDAVHRSRLLVVFVHSDLHPESQRFVGELRASASAKQYLTEKTSFYACSVLHKEGVTLAQDHSVRTFPSLSVFAASGAGNVTLLSQISGSVTPESVVDHIATCLTVHAPLMMQLRQESQNRRRQADGRSPT